MSEGEMAVRIDDSGTATVSVLPRGFRGGGLIPMIMQDVAAQNAVLVKRADGF